MSESDDDLLKAIAVLDEGGFGDQAQKHRVELAKRWNPSLSDRLPRYTPAEFRPTRTIRGGGEKEYVEQQYITQALNRWVGPGGWDYDFHLSGVHDGPEYANESRAGEVIVIGKLTIRFEVDGVIHTAFRTMPGGADIQREKKPPHKAISLEDDIKAAAEDAKKKCASEFGIAADVYWGRKRLQQYDEVHRLL